MPQRDTARCAGCGAPLPADAAQKIVDCRYCGTASNVRPGPADPGEIPAALPDPPGPGIGPDKWRQEHRLHALLKESDPARRLRIAEAFGAGGFDSDAIVWAPHIVDLMLRHPDLDAPLARALAAMSKMGGTRMRQQMFRLGLRHAFEPPGSRGLLLGLASAGAASVKLLLDVADDAAARGDREYAGAALDALKECFYHHAYSQERPVCVDIMLYRFFHVSDFVRDWIIGFIAGHLDSSYHDGRYDREGRDFDFMLEPVLEMLDECVHEAPDQAPRIIREIVSDYSYRKKTESDARRWRQALEVVRTAEGMAAAYDLFRGVYAAYFRDTLGKEFPQAPSVERATPRSADASATPGGAGAVADRALCPGCGKGVDLKEAGPIVTCGACGEELRVQRRLRTMEPVIKGRVSDPLENWTADQLAHELVRAKDARLMAVARELASKDTNGVEYLPHVETIVRVMIAAPDRLDLQLGYAVDQMVATGGAKFREELLAVAREQCLVTNGSHRLLDCLGKLGRDSAELLLDVAEHAESEGGQMYALQALNAIGELVHRVEGEDLLSVAGEIQRRILRAGPMAQSQLSGFLGGRLKPPTGAYHEQVLGFIDSHVVPSETTIIDLPKGVHPRQMLNFQPGGPHAITSILVTVMSCWDSPEDAAEWRRRLDLLQRIQTAETRAAVCLSLYEVPEGFTKEDADRTREVLEPLRGGAVLAPAVQSVLSILPSG